MAKLRVFTASLLAGIVGSMVLLRNRPPSATITLKGEGMRNVRVIDCEAQEIDYHLNILGIRVWRGACQLIARAQEKWTSLGPKRSLPIDIPHDETSLQRVGSDALLLTAWQYEHENPGTDIRAVLSGKKNFDVAVNEQN